MNRCQTFPVILAVALLLAACGGTDEPTADGRSPVASEPAGSETTSAPPDEGAPDFLGVLGGDAQLEGGCAWLETESEGRVEPHWPDGYRVEFDPVRLLGPGGDVVAAEGDLVGVAGRIASDVMTVCQVGPVVEVTNVLGVRSG